MAIEIKQSMKLAQQLVITPQLQQAIKLLQLSRLELSNLIQKELVENPVLEESDETSQQQEEEQKKTNAELHEKAKDDDKGHEHTMDEVGTTDGQMKEPNDFDWENYIGMYNAPGYTGEREAVGSDEAPAYDNVLRTTETIQEHLLWQLQLSSIDKEDEKIFIELIGNINDDGYLQVTVEEVSAACHVNVDRVEKCLDHLHKMDPLGVGARDLKECLKLQATQLGDDQDMIIRLIDNHMGDLERHNYNHISKKVGMPIEEVQRLAHMVSVLEPKPGRPYSSEPPLYIIPDVYVSKVGNEYVITLNEDGLPKLKVSDFYRRALMKGSAVGGQTKEYIQERMRAAMWLIKSIHQRQRTLYRVTESIVKFQQEFFDKGISCLRPLVLKDVADDIEMHESTISRVTTNKYIHSPRGIFELKFFFNSGIDQLEGGGVASEAVKSKIKQLIDNEDLKKPLSDQEISEQLKQFNIDIARRTVAKYREALGFPPSSKRRRFS
jgi:RNA polymerase sigma-54 factor